MRKNEKGYRIVHPPSCKYFTRIRLSILCEGRPCLTTLEDTGENDHPEQPDPYSKGDRSTTPQCFQNLNLRECDGQPSLDLHIRCSICRYTLVLYNVIARSPTNVQVSLRRCVYVEERGRETALHRILNFVK